MRKILLVLFFSTTLSAFKKDLDPYLTIANIFYETGSDNNYIYGEIKSFNDINIPIQKLEDNCIKAALNECVFIKEGAYREHINDVVQSTITEAFYILLSENKELTFYKLIDPNFGDSLINIENACIFGIEWESKILLMQAQLID